jgi:Domain of unknown function (DUF4157)/L,D-transpeptidase catalytic domain
MNTQFLTQSKAAFVPTSSFTPQRGSILRRKCACGGTPGPTEECEECHKKRLSLQRKRGGQNEPGEVPPIVHEVLRSPGQPLDRETRAFFEPRFGHDFSQVWVHTDARAAESARAVNALAYTVGRSVVFASNQHTSGGKKLLAHELAHVVQQKSLLSNSNGLTIDNTLHNERIAEQTADAVMAGHAVGTIPETPLIIQRRAAPYIKKITVHLTPPQTADLEWEGSPPIDVTGSDHFTVSTGKGYGDPDDPPGTCTRSCCTDAQTQCAPPWNRPDRVGSCCTYYGNSFWTGTPLEEHNGWQWWTPIQPNYSRRGIALHQHTEVTGQPIGHGCVRMDEPNAKRIYDFSNGRRTNVTIDGRAAPVACEADRHCETGSSGALEQDLGENRLASEQQPIPGMEGVLT